MCASKLYRFFSSSPSEMGDALAGAFSALAFLWIIVTVLLQSKELKEQRIELKNQRLAAQDMAKAMAAQSQIFEDEKKVRHEERARLVLDQAISNIESIVRYINRFDAKWSFESKNDDDPKKSEYKILSALEGLSGEEIMFDLARQLMIFQILQHRNASTLDINTKSKMREDYEKLLRECLRINDLVDRLGEDQRIRVERLDVENSAKQLIRVLDMDIWENQK